MAAAARPRIIDAKVAFIYQPNETELHSDVEIDKYDPNRERMDEANRPIPLDKADMLVIQRTPMMIYTKVKTGNTLAVFNFTNINLLNRMPGVVPKEVQDAVPLAALSSERKVALACVFKGPAANNLSLESPMGSPIPKHVAVVVSGLTDMRNTGKCVLHPGNACVVRARCYGPADDPAFRYTDWNNTIQQPPIVEFIGPHFPGDKPHRPHNKKRNGKGHPLSAVNCIHNGPVCRPGEVGGFRILF